MHTAELRTPQWVEQAGNGAAGVVDASVCRTSWEGGKWKSGRLTWLTPSAPSWVAIQNTQMAQLNRSGGALGTTVARRPTFRLPPFPACSIHC